MPALIGAPEVSFGNKFFSSLSSLAPADVKRVTTAIDRLGQDPNHPSLHLKPLQGDASGRLHSDPGRR